MLAKWLDPGSCSITRSGSPRPQLHLFPPPGALVRLGSAALPYGRSQSFGRHLHHQPDGGVLFFHDKSVPTVVAAGLGAIGVSVPVLHKLIG